MKHVAIIGSGPAGCYLAEQLLRALPKGRIDVIERLPVPFGLVRYGVAPDHQGTKNISRLLDRTLGRDRVRFFGHVDVGRDVKLDELRALYDAVVLATGAPQDRRLGIPGEDLAGVVGSGAFVGWYNNHPDYPEPAIAGLRSAVVIGNGNVAIDVVRVLAKTGDELAGSDLTPEVTGRLAQQPLEVIHVVGRRGAEHAKFAPEEVAELGHLARARPAFADPEALARARAAGGGGKTLEVLEGFRHDARDVPVRILFHFDMRPERIEGDGRVASVHFAHTDGHQSTLAAQLVVTCIGYETTACDTRRPERGIFANDAARIEDGLYVVGWAGRGPSGTIPTNRAEAQRVAKRMAGEVGDHGRRGGDALAELLAQRGVRSVDHAGWKRIEAAETARAGAGRCRAKFASTRAMMAALDG